MVTGVSASNGAVAGGSPVDFDASGRDMVLMATPEKKSKKWAIALSVLVLLVACVILLLVFWLLSNRNNVDEIAKWENYYNLLMYGAIDNESFEFEEVNEETWYPAKVDLYDAEEYYLSLARTFEEFQRTADSEQYSDYFERVRAFLIYHLLDYYDEIILDIFLKNNDEQQVINYIDELTNKEKLEQSMSYYLKRYFLNSFRLMRLYKTYGCYDDANDYVSCIIAINDDNKSSYLSSESNAFDQLENYYEVVFEPTFFSETVYIDSSMGAA